MIRNFVYAALLTYLPPAGAVATAQWLIEALR
jgi:hypothetical protein